MGRPLNLSELKKGEYMKCVICDNEIYTEFGHNAEPVKDGRCCDMCNQTVVIPRRIKDAQSNKR